MKKKVILTSLTFVLSIVFIPAHAQINIGKKLQNKINQHVDQQINKSVDGVLSAPEKKLQTKPLKPVQPTRQKTLPAARQLKQEKNRKEFGPSMISWPETY